MRTELNLSFEIAADLEASLQVEPPDLGTAHAGNCDVDSETGVVFDDHSDGGAASATFRLKRKRFQCLPHYAGVRYTSDKPADGTCYLHETCPDH